MKKKLSPALRRLLNIGLWANVIEWYEFLVYIHLSPIIAQLFFKSQLPIVGLIQAFALFALSYLARPLGSLFFGYFSEKRGRKASLQLSLMMMSVPTILIGCLPTYASIGGIATFCLLCLRLIQGFAAGGELPTTACYMFEHSPARHKSVLLAITCNSSAIGSVLGSLVASSLYVYYDEQTILNGVWRLPFLLAIPLTAWIYSIRKHIEDFPMESTNANNRYPLKILFQKEKLALLKGIVLCHYASNIGGYLLFWIPFYLTHFLDYPATTAHPMNTVMLGIAILLSIGAAWLTRYIGVARILSVSIISSILLAYPLFKLMQIPNLSALYASVFILNVTLSGIGGVIFEVIGSLFKEVRALGMSVCFTLPVSLIGGATPMLLTFILHKTGCLLFPAFYIIFSGLIALPAALTFKPQNLTYR